ncbi:MAG: phosphotransferase [Actinomycetota bacterium]|nr:phosphotransferase [Actinomycetota bacterium]
MADAVALVAAAAPAIDVRDAVGVEGGWDSFVLDTGEWIFKFPRRPEVARALRAEIALLDALAPALPLRAPRYEVVADRFAGYRKIAGEQLSHERQTEAAGRNLGTFLAALHAFPVEAAVAAGLPATDWRGRQEALVAELESRVSPLLDPGERAAAHAAFTGFLSDDAAFDFERALIHYDLGPAHLLAGRDGRLLGVIDWGDAWVGDPAADLAWALHGSTEPFARGVAATYPGVTESVAKRALHYHRLGPWHEVVHGLENGDAAWVENGLAGVRARLRLEPGGDG